MAWIFLGSSSLKIYSEPERSFFANCWFGFSRFNYSIRPWSMKFWLLLASIIRVNLSFLASSNLLRNVLRFPKLCVNILRLSACYSPILTYIMSMLLFLNLFLVMLFWLLWCQRNTKIGLWIFCRHVTINKIFNNRYENLRFLR